MIIIRNPFLTKMTTFNKILRMITVKIVEKLFFSFCKLGKSDSTLIFACINHHDEKENDLIKKENDLMKMISYLFQFLQIGKV